MENLFRGKRVDCCELIEGFYYTQIGRNSFSNENEILWEKHFIKKPDGVFDNLFQALEVDPETVGQLTPFTDIAGKKAFVGDRYMTEDSDVVYTIYSKNGAICAGVDFENAYPIGWEYNSNKPDCIGMCEDWFSKHAKIIGNIHE